MSEEEQAWLTLFGYPSAWELENLDLLDWDAIERAHSLNNPITSVLLAERRLQGGGVVGARAMFDNASYRGSLYGLMQSALLDAQLVNPDKVALPQHAYVSFRLATALAEQLGDHRARAFADANLGHLTTRERASLDAETMRSLQSYFETWQRDKVRQGKPQLAQAALRPNASEWRALRPDELPTVTVVQAPSRFLRRDRS
jgi:hypothetical protein